MQAIVTKHLGPTNTRGSRVIARCEAGSLTVPWNWSFNITQNHRLAAQQLRDKLGWNDPAYPRMMGGGMPTSSKEAFVFVFADEHDGLSHEIEARE